MNKLRGSALASIAIGLSPFGQRAIRENAMWEQRHYKWSAKYGKVEDISDLYKKLADVAMAYGFNDLTNVQPWFTTESRGRLSLKKVAESLMGKKLPDINPAKCIEYAKETPISAEVWYRGCTDGFNQI